MRLTFGVGHGWPSCVLKIDWHSAHGGGRARYGFNMNDLFNNPHQHATTYFVAGGMPLTASRKNLPSIV